MNLKLKKETKKKMLSISSSEFHGLLTKAAKTVVVAPSRARKRAPKSA